MSEDQVTIHRLRAPEELDRLEPLWISLHQHHQTVSPLPYYVTDDATSWSRRRDHYRELTSKGDGLFLLAESAGRAVGYAAASFHDGPDASFAIGAKFAELQSLAVEPAHRGRGIGTLLLGELDDQLAAAGVRDMVVSVMIENEAALRFYRRRGLIPAEIYMWRVGDRAGEALRDTQVR